MANNKSIQLLRKNGAPTTQEQNSLLPGQPLYDITNNHLYIGTGGGGLDLQQLNQKIRLRMMK